MKKLLVYLLLCLTGFCWATDQNSQNQKFDTLFEHLKRYREQDNEKQMLSCGKKALLIAESLDDYSAKAKVYIALGNYYSDKNESSITAYDYYYKAYRAYSHKKEAVKMAKTLVRLAIIEKNTRNYLKSKESCFLALELLGDKPSEFLESIYNNLGIVYGELQDVKTSVMYHKKALALRMQDNQQELILQSYNNIATAYLDNGDLNNAASYYKKGLSYPLLVLQQFPEEYARLIDNFSHLQFLQGKKEVLPNLLKALSIRETCGHQAGIIISYLHLASYYQDLNQLPLSNTYANKAYQKASKTENYRDILTALSILEANSQYLKNYKKALEYANKHKQTVDYLAHEELKINEKFADIRYSASQKEKENKSLRQENKEQQLLTEKRKKYLYIAIGLFGIIALAGIGYFQYSRMEQKQKEQKAENEIMRLLFESKEAAERAKYQEQERISHDLHDSIAGKLSGLMLKLDTLAVSSPLEIKKKLDPVVENVDAILQELSSIVHDMNEQQVSETSYPMLIEEIAKSQLSEKIKISFFIDDSIDWNTISNRIKLAFYYIIQQGVRNIHEHSEATEAFVKIESEENVIFLSISDNGKGINTTPSNRGMGIPGIKKRTEELGGKFKLQSGEDKDTTITIKIPLS